jgi:hypothetical protein
MVQELQPSNVTDLCLQCEIDKWQTLNLNNTIMYHFMME